MQNLRIVRRGTMAMIAVLAWSPLMAQGEQRPTGRVVEIRSYNLKPGARDRFHQLFLREALPMLQRWKVDVVGYGPSLHDRDSYYLMRAYGRGRAAEKRGRVLRKRRVEKGAARSHPRRHRHLHDDRHS